RHGMRPGDLASAWAGAGMACGQATSAHGLGPAWHAARRPRQRMGGGRHGMRPGDLASASRALACRAGQGRTQATWAGACMACAARRPPRHRPPRMGRAGMARGQATSAPCTMAPVHRAPRLPRAALRHAPKHHASALHAQKLGPMNRQHAMPRGVEGARACAIQLPLRSLEFSKNSRITSFALNP
ncbi:hypothetical protein L3055_10840, partial [Corynebacterium sp. MC-02]|nr:hypothetical protein [Corynebacterium pseudokroppenstedtii]